MRRKLLLQLGIVDLLLGIAAIVLFTLDDRGLIISLGYKTAKTLVTIGKIAILALLMCWTLYCVWRLWQAQRREKRTRLQPSSSPLPMAEARMTDPAEIHRELQAMAKKRPTLKADILRAAQQMDDLLQKEGQLEEVARRDKVSLMNTALETLKRAEIPVLENIVRVLSYAEVFSRDAALQAQNQRRMQEHLDWNDRILRLCDEVLSKAVDYGDGRTNRRFDTLDLDAALHGFDQKLAMIGKSTTTGGIAP